VAGLKVSANCRIDFEICNVFLEIIRSFYRKIANRVNLNSLLSLSVIFLDEKVTESDGRKKKLSGTAIAFNVVLA
jgi:hypothetical protein